MLKGTARFAVLAGLVGAWVVLAAAGGGPRIRQEIFVVDADAHTFIVGAVVTVSYVVPGDPTVYTQQAETTAPHGNVRFTIPADADALSVEIAADGYETLSCCITMKGRTRMGGKGYWIELTPHGPSRAR